MGEAVDMHRKLLLAFFALGCILRINGIFNDLWLDEIWALRAAQAWTSPWAIFAPTTLDGHLSLYTIIMWVLNLAGSPLWAYRLPALLFGLFIPVLIFKLLAPRDRAVASGAAALISISYVEVLYSGEARGYAPMLACGVMALLFLERLHRSLPERLETRTLYAFWLAVIGAALFHFSFVLVFGAYIVWSFVSLPAAPWRRLCRIFNLHGVPLIVVLILYFTTFRHLAEGSGPLGSYLDVLAGTLSIFAGGPLPSGFDFTVTALALGVALLVCSLLIAELAALRREGDSRWLLYFMIVFGVPILIVGVLNPRVLMLRYFLCSITFGYVLLSSRLVRLARASSGERALMALIVIAFTIGQSRHLTHFVMYGRGLYRDALGAIVASDLQTEAGGLPSAEPVLIAGDHDFRNALVIDFYRELNPDLFRIRYVPSDTVNDEAVPVDGRALTVDSLTPATNWYLIHSQDSAFSPAPMLGRDGIFRLWGSYRSAELSGWSWFVYRRDVGTTLSGR